MTEKGERATAVRERTSPQAVAALSLKRTASWENPTMHSVSLKDLHLPFTAVCKLTADCEVQPVLCCAVIWTESAQRAEPGVNLPDQYASL